MKLLLPRFLMVYKSWGWWILDIHFRYYKTYGEFRIMCAGRFFMCVRWLVIYHYNKLFYPNRNWVDFNRSKYL